jgi:hypothetical protein
VLLAAAVLGLQVGLAHLPVAPLVAAVQLVLLGHQLSQMEFQEVGLE